jgi:TRAP-type C4-dicarboxylate transport system permease small subunit
MNALKIIAIVLIVAGIAALLYGGFTYTKKTHDVSVGPIDFSVKEKERVNIPLWAGIAAIVAGGVLLVIPAKK